MVVAAGCWLRHPGSRQSMRTTKQALISTVARASATGLIPYLFWRFMESSPCRRAGLARLRVEQLKDGPHGIVV